jgi:serine phosphatase RsbU (regulator of sigma subunit)
VSGGHVDDVWVTPFRFSEVYSKIRQYQRLMSWGEVNELNDSLTTLVQKFQEDLALAERLQKAKFPERFPQIKGFQVKSRYYAGLRAGGDYFDIAEAKNQKQLSLFLTDSSSYGLSSSVLGAMMKVAMRLTGEEATSTASTVRKIYNELLMTLGERDQLSLFFGTIRRTDLSLQYVNYGNTRAFLARPGKAFEVLPVSGNAINRKDGTPKAEESSVVLQPEDRLLVLSDGYLAPGETWEKFIDTLNRMREREPTEILNELGFRVKSQSEDEDGFPPQDCSAVLLDVNPNVLRLAG